MNKISTTKTTLQIFWQHTKRYKSALAIIYPSILVAQFAEDMLAPLLISGILSNLAAGNRQALTLAKIWPILLIISALELSGNFIWNMIVRVFWRMQDKIMCDLNLTIFKHLSSMSYRFFSDRFAGSLVNQTNKFVSSYERFTDAMTFSVFKLFVSLLLTAIILAPKAPVVVLAILIITAIYAPVVWIFRRRQVAYTRKWASAETKRTGQLADAIGNISVVKSFSNEEFEYKRMESCTNEVYDRSIDTMRINMKHELLTGTLQRSINIAVLILSVILAVNGKIAVGIIYLSLTYSTNILGRLWDLNITFRQFTRVFGDTSDIAKIMLIPPEIKDPEHPEMAKIVRGSISFENIAFVYDKNQKALFDDVRLTIKAGEKIGLVGLSGSGKTTLTRLLLRFSDINSGKILIDGQDITKITQNDLRNHIAYVPQEPLLFHRSLSENIAYGNTEASQPEIIGAAKLANAHEFIKGLPRGYETLVGERGVKLSGGQRQRVAIARAILKNSRILVLDEATSALDSESEQLIQKALWTLMEGRTAIVIAHRLSTIQKMDRIIVLDNGCIIEEGSHKELIANKGIYASLWEHQSGGFIED